MKSRIIGKIASAVILSLLFALGMHFDHAWRGRMSRDEFLAKQGQRYDKHFARPDPFVASVIGCLVLTVPVLGLYEGVARVVSKALRGMDEKDSS